MARKLAFVIAEKEKTCLPYSVDDVVSAFRCLPPCQAWFDFIRSMVAKKTRVGRLDTAKNYRDALNSFSSFRQGYALVLDALDGELISLYEAWLKGRGLKRNSSSCYLRTCRTLYRKAVRMGLTTDNDIFRHIFTGFARTSKRAIPLESVHVSYCRQVCPPDSRPPLPVAHYHPSGRNAVSMNRWSTMSTAALRKSAG